MGDGEQRDWLRAELYSADADGDAAKLVGLGALGVEVQDSDTYMEGADIPPVPEGRTRLIAFFDADRSAGELADQIESTLDDVETTSVADYDDRSWETAWMDYFEATRLSPRVFVGPPWDMPEAPENGVALVVEPGMAFGTGSHETTQLSAKLIDDAFSRRDLETVLDVGCGSAILSMIAAGLGARRVVGIDVDERAVEVAHENLAKNALDSDGIELSTRPISDFDETFDLVVANILAPVLLELKASLLRCVAPGAELILSGISTETIADVREGFDHPDFTEVESLSDGPWRAISFRRDRP